MRSTDAPARDRRRRARFRRARVGLVLLALVLAFPAAASAALSWSAGTPVDQNGAQRLLAMSCPSSNQCTAVDFIGQEVTFNPGSPGTPTPVVIDAGALLSAISCPSTSQCTAVDDSGNAITFNPTAPAAATRSAIAPGTQLNAVSCPSTTQCTTFDALGRAETFNPSAPGSPTPVTLDASRQPASIQCLSATMCVALSFNVGNQDSSVVSFDPTTSGPPTLVTLNILLLDFACTSSTQCVGVSATGKVTQFQPGALGFTTPVTIDTRPLNRVSCPAALVCAAVDDHGQEFAFDPAAPGSPTANPIGGGKSLNAVACPSVTQCTAAGDAGSEATFNPTATPQNPSAANIDTGNEFGHVACPSATQCTAVDHVGQEVTFDPLSPGAPAPVRIHGTSAIVGIGCPSAAQCTTLDFHGQERTFNPSAPGNAAPTSLGLPLPSQPAAALSCASATRCTLVDQQHFLTFDPTSPGSPSEVAITGGNLLTAIACPSTSQCTAVDALGAVATFDPTTSTSPTASSFGGFLHAISCPSSTECTAVGPGGRVVTFNPTSSGSPSSATIDSGRSLNDVSCASATFCVAVDAVGNAVEGNPVAGTWTVEAVPGAATLAAIACVSPAECVAVDLAGRAFLGMEVPSAGSPPSITGTATQGQTLTEHHGTWSNNPTSYSYEWRQCDAAGNNCTAIGSATAQTFTLTAAQVGHTVRVSETARNAGGAGVAALSPPTAVVQPPASAPANTSPPTITGKAKLGQKLSATPGIWSGGGPITYRYQWQGCSPRCTNLAGRTGFSLTLGPATIGTRIRVVIRATNALGNATASSAQTGPVTPTPAQIKRALQTALVPTGDTGKIAALLVIGGYNSSFTAPAPGTLTLSWYIVPPGGRLARAQKPILVAVGRITVKAARRTTVKLKLSAAGRRRLRHAAGQLTLTGRATFALARGPRVTTVKTFAIRR